LAIMTPGILHPHSRNILISRRVHSDDFEKDGSVQFHKK
jgi:hypothetical protein